VLIGVIAFNAAVGFLQEFKAEKTMDSLRKMSSPTSRVLRNGHQVVVPTIDLVPGDILYLESGDVIGADCRLFEVFNFDTDEALLTGEALPISKEIAAFSDPELPLGDRINLSFASTTVTKGRAKAVVYATGMTSEVGKIAKKLMETDKNKKTPLQKGLDKMAWVLLAVASVSVLIVFGANKFKVNSDVLLYAIGLAIATIPEGLIAVVTLTMSMGVSTLAKKRALVRQLVALESLGSVTNICSDKTGTLTQSKMVLVRAWLPSEGVLRVAGLGFEPVGIVTKTRQLTASSDTRVNFATTPGDEKSKLLDNDATTETVTVDHTTASPNVRRLAEAAALCNMSEIKCDAATGEWFGIGDPTEIALQVFASKLSMGKPLLTSDTYQWSVVCEYPFDSGIKRMSVVAVNNITGEKLLFLKGATERVVPCCSGRQDGDLTIATDSDGLQAYLDPRIQEMARDGLRVLSIAYRHLTEAESELDMNKADREGVELNMTFLGLVGIYDPPRPESLPSVMECYRAGIQVTMLTGDHPATAAAIARQVGILQHETEDDSHCTVTMGQLVMTAREFDSLSDEEIDALPELPHRFCCYTDACDLVFRARGTVFATLTIGILLHAYNCRRIRGPMWNWHMIKRFHENKFLLAGFISGTILCLLCMYVPGLNTKVLKMKGISWEWGVVLITLLVFIIISEIYKFGKRRFLKPLTVATEEQVRLQRIWTENTLTSMNNNGLEK
ncbi:hypothetical protein GGF42_007178, partial [Coemansia sp. RSA 2424]